MKKTLRILALMLICMMIVPVFGCAKKQEFPTRALEMVIPFGVGGASDISAREFGKYLEKYVKQPIKPVNKGGSGTVEGFEYALAQPADGYTLFELTTSVIMKESQSAASKKFTETFDPLVMMMTDFQILCTYKGNEKFKTADELVTYAKANPGAVKIAGISAGAADDCTQSTVAKGLGIKWTYVPYTSGSEIKAAILGKEIALVQDKVASILPLLQSGDLIPILIFADNRVDIIPQLKGIPCISDYGISGIPISWRCIAVRKDTPKEVKDILFKACSDTFNDPDFKAYKEKEFLNIMDVAKTPEAISKVWQAELKAYTQFYKETGVIK